MMAATPAKSSSKPAMIARNERPLRYSGSAWVQ